MSDPISIGERLIREHEAKLAVGTKVQVLPRPECYYCRSAEDEDGLIGTIEHIGDRNYRWRSEAREPGASAHIYWVAFPDTIPSQNTTHSHFAAAELMPLCPRCEHEQDRHTIVDFGCAVIVGDDDNGPIICDCEQLFGTAE